ncbi:GTPase HflX [Pyruvatibacter sp. HU-CL02332]|uniref:GTPase HflX n=1 Tax=Pyruvatibacter sp. HU-CL02332 TaxID=3127650 RepID=UPI0029688A02|nr:GTPase HflX [Alphaproteobacteria bacterium]
MTPVDDRVAATESGRAIVLHPWIKSGPVAAAARHTQRAPEDRLEEAVGLAAAIHLDIAQAIVVPVADPKPGTLFGQGKVDEIKHMVELEEAGLVIIDGQVTPIQQRNLERAWKAKVLDRTGLILEIFGERAATREGSLQVELAHLMYQKSRLVRSWTHLERQRGGLGFVGGPGETQIEADRRHIQDRITKLENQLERVTRTRELHRKTRRRVPYPVVALVGYTNAGKSTLFNRLTASGVLAEDMLFATLDPTMRALDMPGGQRVILSDTVGFISDLPTSLVAAFRATLEEVLEAELILHVRDISHPDTAAQRQDVHDVLRELGVDPQDTERVIEVANKIDQLDGPGRAVLADTIEGDPNQIAVSAITGEGIDPLNALIEGRVTAHLTEIDVLLGPGDAAARAWLHENCTVTGEDDPDDEGNVRILIKVSSADTGRINKRFPGLLPEALEL